MRVYYFRSYDEVEINDVSLRVRYLFLKHPSFVSITIK
jgi:hypothetical protein